jgi:ADP-heptose:LPS heptosyltransferase
MAEKHLYFCNILVSRWVNALGLGQGRLKSGFVSGVNVDPSASGAIHSVVAIQSSIKSILVVKWDEIGDMAAAVHVFGTLKLAYPDAKITVLCKPFVASLIAGDPAVDEVITSIEDWQERYDLLVELRGTWKTLWKSLALRTMPKYRVDRGWVRFLQRGDQPHEVVTNERIIRPLLGKGEPIAKRALYPSAAEIAQAQEWSDWALSGEGGAQVDPSFNQSEGKETDSAEFIGYAILHTGARRELRRWPLERFVILSKWLLKEKNLMPIWVGTSDEEHQLDEAFVLGAAGKKWVAPEGSSLLSFYAFIASSKLYAGNESGPLQLADIAEIPLVAIYGPGVPDVFYPMSAQSRVLHEVLDCNPCDQIHCVRPSDRCIDRIGLASVQLAVSEVLGCLI